MHDAGVPSFFSGWGSEDADVATLRLLLNRFSGKCCTWSVSVQGLGSVGFTLRDLWVQQNLRDSQLKFASGPVACQAYLGPQCGTHPGPYIASRILEYSLLGRVGCYSWAW